MFIFLICESICPAVHSSVYRKTSLDQPDRSNYRAAWLKTFSGTHTWHVLWWRCWFWSLCSRIPLLLSPAFADRQKLSLRYRPFYLWCSVFIRMLASSALLSLMIQLLLLQGVGLTPAVELANRLQKHPMFWPCLGWPMDPQGIQIERWIDKGSARPLPRFAPEAQKWNRNVTECDVNCLNVWWLQ